MAFDDTYTVEEAIEYLGFGKFQIKLSLLTGLAWMADAMEMMILSILSPALHCSWGLVAWQRAFITTSVFVGMMASSTFWGSICDNYGRKTALIMCSIFTFYFGLLSSFSPTYIWMIILRGLTGFGIGGAPQSVVLYSEFLPYKYRAKCLILVEVFWGIGTCFEVLLALLVMPTLGWRWLLGFSSLPLLLFSAFCMWLPESARYLVACQRYKDATAIIERIARENGRPLPIGRLVADGEKNASTNGIDMDKEFIAINSSPSKSINSGNNFESPPKTSAVGNNNYESIESNKKSSAEKPNSFHNELNKRGQQSWENGEDQPQDSSDLKKLIKPVRGRIKDLFAPDLRLTTFLLWIIWMVNAFAYYGIVLMTTELFESGDKCHGGGKQRLVEQTCLTACNPLKRSDYIDLLWTTLAEFPGLFLTVFIIESLGRKLTMAVEFIIFSIFIFLLNICSSRAIMTTFIFIARTVISAGFQATYVYTPEVYPTTIRASGLGTCSMMARIGAILTPFVAQVMLRYSANGAFDLYALSGILAAVCALLLPIETRGREMKESLSSLAH